MFSPYDYPEIEELFGQLLDELFNESGRGAILISTSYVEEHLTKYIETVLPDQNKKYKNKLLQYPGPLSSFSAKIELSYAFRLIDKNLYNRLNALRSIRNEAAHSSSTFSLNELNEKMSEVFNLGPTIPYYIKTQAIELMMRAKLESVNSLFEKHELEITDRKKIVTNIFDNEKVIKSLEKQIPFWELLCGVCILCGLISYQKGQTSNLIPKDKISE